MSQQPKHHQTSIAAGWTDERVELLKKMWAAGLSASQVAKTLGGITRNSVIGKVHRMKLPGRAKPSKPVVAARAARIARAPRPPRVERPKLVIAGNGAVLQVAKAPAPRVSTLEAQPLPGVDPKPWLERAFGECAFVVGGDGADALSCCAKVKSGTPYCAPHNKIMYAPRPPSKAKGEKRWFDQVARRYAA